MIDTKRTARFALIASAALALPAAASAAQGTADTPPPAPPAPPAPPSPPAPPAPPAIPEMGSQVVIVERQGDKDGAEHVRTVTRDGKTFVFKTDRPLTDAEVEARIAQVEAGIPPVPPVPPMAGKDGHRVQQRVIVIDGNTQGVTDIVSETGDHCKGKAIASDVDASEEKDGKVTRVRIRTCGTPGEIEKHAMAEALEGVREARERIARDKSLSDSIRKQVLDELDAEIAKLKAKG